MKFVYTGESEIVFPTLGITVKQGDSFDAPDDFSAPFVSPFANKLATPDKKTKVGE